MVDHQAIFSDDVPTGHLSYYDRRTNGPVDWMDWIIVFFFMLVTWILGQFALTSPLLPMLAESDPEAANQVNEMMLASATADPIGSMLMIFGLLILLPIGGLIGVIAGMIHYLGARGRGSKITALIGAIIAILGVVLMLSNQGGMGEANKIILSVMGTNPIAYLLFLLTFPAALAGLYFGWKVVHQKSLTALHTSFAKFRWGRAAQAFLIGWAVLFAFSFIAGAITGNSPQWQFDPSRFWIFAIVSLLFLPIQSATEEIIVRGYMNKGLIHFFKNKWVAFVLTSGLFMALHLSNPEATAGAEAGNLAIVMSGYFFFGFAACLMVLIDDGLESAIGVHAANNTFAGIFVNYEGSVLPTPSLWQVQAEPTGDALGVILVLSTILALLWITRSRALSRS